MSFYTIYTSEKYEYKKVINKLSHTILIEMFGNLKKLIQK